MIRGVAPGRGFDLVGTAIGTVALDRLLTGTSILPGDVVLGLESSGLHSNGFTLARRALLEHGKLRLDDPVPELGGTLGAELLRPTCVYVRPALAVLDAGGPARGLPHPTADG